MKSMQHLLEPARVAVIGASRSPNGYGNKVLRHLKLYGFPGEIYPINRNADEIEGLRCYPDVADVPGPLDCVMIVIPARGVVEAVQSCAAANVRTVVVGTVGFAETGTADGIGWQKEIVRIGKESGIRILGPNTNGIFNASARLPLGYNASFADVTAPGPVSVVAHSGALFSHLANSMIRFGTALSKYIPVGNEADLTLLDFLEYLIEDADTKVIGLIIEALHDVERFRALADRARAACKPIVAMKLGRSRVGAGASLAHASRLAGGARAYAALFRSAGVATVPSVEAMAAASVFLCRPPSALKGDIRMIGVSSSGAGAALLADLAEDRGIPLAVDADGNWGAEVAQCLAGIETSNPLRNPIDTGSLGGQQKLEPVFKALEAQHLNGPTLIFTHTLQRPGAIEAVAANAIARQERTQAPVALVSPAGLGAEVEARYRAGGVAVFHDTATCFDGLKAWYDIGKDADPLPASASQKAAAADIHAPGLLTEAEASALLKNAGVPMVDFVLTYSAAEIDAAGDTLAYPLVLKALAPGIAHKAKSGLVVTGIMDAAALTRARQTIASALEKLGHDTATVPFIVQPMVRAKAEFIVGVSAESGIGHFLIVGLGGVHTEIMDSVSLFPIPSSRDFVRARLAETAAGRLLASLAQDCHRDLERAFLDILDSLQAFTARWAPQLESVDINPVLVGERGCVAVDALVIFREPSIAGS